MAYTSGSYTSSGADLTGSGVTFGIEPYADGLYSPASTHASFHHQVTFAGLDSGGGTLTFAWAITRGGTTFTRPAVTIDYASTEQNCVIDLAPIMWLGTDTSLDLTIQSDNANDTSVDLVVKQINMQQVNAGAIGENADRATDLAEIARYLIANSAEPITDYVADDSLLAKLLASGGDISDYDDTTDSQEAIADAVGTVDTNVDAIKDVTDVLPDAGALTTIAADTARLTEERATVLTDWINGGRLDLLLDGASAPTAAQVRAEIDSNSTQLAAIKVVTDATGSNTYYVSKDGDDANDGLSWNTAKLKIGAAITVADAAGNGAFIWIGEGEYDETVTMIDGLKMQGCGDAAIVTSADLGGAVEVGSTKNATLRDLRIENTSASGKGLGALVSGGLLCERLHVTGPLDGIFVAGTGTVFRDCQFFSPYDACAVQGDLIAENCRFHTTGTGGTINPPAAVQLNLNSTSHLVILRNCQLIAERTAEKTVVACAARARGKGRLLLDHCQLFAENTHASSSGGISTVQTLGTAVVMLDGCEVQSTSAGSGDVYDLDQQDTSAINVSGTKYDRTKTNGTITHVDARTITTETTIIESK